MQASTRLRVTKKNATELFRYERVVWLRFFFILSTPQKHKRARKFLLALFGYLSTCKILIFSFFKRNAYATRDTTLSNAFPIPNSNAIPISDGVHAPVI